MLDNAEEVGAVRHSSSRWPALVAGIVVAFAASGAEGQIASTAQQQTVKPPAVATVSLTARRSIDRFSAVTADMTPKNVTLSFSVLDWSDEAGRAETVNALGAADPMAALMRLPTLGYVWLSSSPVGIPLKYAARTVAADGSERITFVTDKPLDYYDFKKWAPDAPLAAKETQYGVVELYLDPNGHGSGTLSLVADVKVDAKNHDVTLADGAPRLLINAKVEHDAYSQPAAGSSPG